MSAPLRVPMRDESDLVVARRQVRLLAQQQGLREAAVEALATAVTEIARNILVHSVGGELRIEPVARGARRGVGVTLVDGGPGIADVDLAMQDGYSTSGTLGLGLPGAKRLVDEFEIDSEPGRGTRVKLRQWAPEAPA